MYKLLTASCLFLVIIACSSSPQSEPIDSTKYYQLRLKNLLQTEELSVLHSINDCVELIILQPKKCSSCTQEVLDSLLRHPNNEMMRYYLIITDADKYNTAMAMGLDYKSNTISFLSPEKSLKLGYNAMGPMKFEVCAGQMNSYLFLR